MRLLERYIFKNAGIAFLAVLFGLTGVIWVTQALREVGPLIAKGQSFAIFLGITSLALPGLVLLLAPISLFIAVLYTLNKLNGDSELIVMSAAGGRPGMLMRPFAILSVLVLLLDAAMSLVVMPRSARLVRDLVTSVSADFITRVVRPGQFTALETGFTFHYRERGPNGELRGVFMQDRRDANQSMSYIAEEGQTAQKGDQKYLVLHRGNIQRQTKDSSGTTFTTFEDYTLDLAEFSQAGGLPPLRAQERDTRELLWPNMKDSYVAHQIGRFRADLTDRFASPLYALVAAVIGFVMLGQARTTRQGRGAAIVLAAFMFLAIRIGGIAVSFLVVPYAGMVALAYVLPLSCVGVGLFLIFGLPSLRLGANPVRKARPVALGLS